MTLSVLTSTLVMMKWQFSQLTLGLHVARTFCSRWLSILGVLLRHHLGEECSIGQMHSAPAVAPILVTSSYRMYKSRVQGQFLCSSKIALPGGSCPCLYSLLLLI